MTTRSPLEFSPANSGDDFDSNSRRVVREFLQTVVVLDDLAEFTTQKEKPTSDLENPDYMPTRPDEPPPMPATLDDPASSLEGYPLDAKTVIDGFAELGSVCAVLKPIGDENYRDRVTAVAVRSDIVVLDWKIGDSYGDHTLSIIQSILEHDSDSGRMRLIAIYTGEPNLENIADRVASNVSNYYIQWKLKKHHRFRFTKGPLHVVVLSKPGTLNSSHPRYSKQVVSESDLPDRLVDEFTTMAAGLLRNVALAGVTLVRNDTYRLLSKFDPTLDAAYLGHRLMLPHPPDSEQHILEAFVSELQSVLEHRRPDQQADLAAIRRWLLKQQIDGLDLAVPFHFDGRVPALERWCELLEKGIDSTGITGPLEGKAQLRSRATEAFVLKQGNAIDSNRQLSSLFVLKSRYSEDLPRLTLGTVLQRRGARGFRYYLCLQPKCDSVRLKEKTGFPLLPLDAQENLARRFHLAVKLSKGKWKHFDLRPEPNLLTVPIFQPETTPPHAVVAKQNDGHYSFEDVGGRRYLWVTEMKDEHAMKIAADVAAGLARPGPNYSEWLRQAARLKTTLS